MGYLADKAAIMPLNQNILEEVEKFSCGNEDLDEFFHNDSIAYAEDPFGKLIVFVQRKMKKKSFVLSL